MSGDEVFVTFLSGGLALAAWLSIYVRSVRFSRYELPRASVNALLFALPACLMLVMFVLRTLASHDVREDNRYIAMYSLMGAAWIGFAPAPFLPGISLRDDFFERRNPSAVLAVLGYMLGSTFCFSGGNIGDGPGWWVVVFCAIIANGALALLWMIANQFAHIADRITIDRDPAIGLRVAGFFAGSGLVLGRAVAGDWTSLDATLRDFAAKAWPVLILVVILIVAERLAKPRFHRDEQAMVARGFFPAMFYVLIGFVAVAAQGRIE
jgi:hypothetical protein